MNQSKIQFLHHLAVFALITLIILFAATPALCASHDADTADIIINKFSDSDINRGNTVEDLAPNCKSAILFEATTGTILFSKNADMQLPPASMTKVLTAIVVLEQNPNLEGTLTVDERAVSNYYCSSMEPQRHLLEGEEISYEECMKYFLVHSGNEAGTAFAFDIADDFGTFIDMMNAKAKELGCENTHYSDPTGLSSNNHYTTVSDMVKMCEYAMSFEKFRECVSYESGTVPASNVRAVGFDYDTTNYVKFPDDRYESPYSSYVSGIKTGWTPAAGYCFSGCMEKDGLVFYSVAMGGDFQDNGDGRILQGDFIDTINMYSMTEGLTSENIGEYFPRQSYITWITAGAILFTLLIIGLRVYNKKRNKK